jgi:hypothetical protein
MPSIIGVMQFTGMNYDDVLSLPTDSFLLFYKHYFVNKMNETNEGRQYLADCERYKITEPDYHALRQFTNMLNNK